VHFSLQIASLTRLRCLDLSNNPLKEKYIINKRHIMYSSTSLTPLQPSSQSFLGFNANPFCAFRNSKKDEAGNVERENARRNESASELKYAVEVKKLQHACIYVTNVVCMCVLMTICVGMEVCSRRNMRVFSHVHVLRALTRIFFIPSRCFHSTDSCMRALVLCMQAAIFFVYMYQIQ